MLCALFLVVRSSGSSSLGTQASYRGGFSCWGAQALDAPASVAVATWGLVAQGRVRSSQTRDLSEPVSPALADGFLSSVPPGKWKRWKRSPLCDLLSFED